MEGELNEQSLEVEKGAPARRCACRGDRSHRGRCVQLVLKAARTLRLQLVYFVCRVGTYPWNERMGVSGYISPRTRQLLCLAGTSWSFDSPAKFFKESCGLSVSDNTIREVCQQEVAAGRGPVDRQWPSGRGVQAHDWAAAEANRDAVAGPAGQPE